MIAGFSWLLQVKGLLGRYPDLMEGFNEFFARCEKIGNSC